MFPLSIGGDIIDTPGIKTLGFNHFDVLDVAQNYKEIFITSQYCKFNNCTHRNEPKCAVKSAVEEGRIHPSRYASYLHIVGEVEEQIYWERHKDF
jgi:ribosome biogenesis GTPase